MTFADVLAGFLVETLHSLADHGNQDNRQALQEQSQRMPQREHVTRFVAKRRHATHRRLGREFSGLDVNCEEKRDGLGCESWQFQQP